MSQALNPKTLRLAIVFGQSEGNRVSKADDFQNKCCQLILVNVCKRHQDFHSTNV